MNSVEFVHALGNWSVGPGPVYRRLAGAIRAGIERGEIVPGSRMPAERTLARLLAVSRTTVVSAYEMLRQELSLESRQGSGTRVRARSPRQLSVALREDASGSFRRHPVYRGLIEGSAGTIEFLGAHLPAASALVREVSSLGKSALGELARGPGYLPMGLQELRQAIATHLGKSGLPTGEEQILVTSGAQQAIGLIGALLLGRGDAVVVENPTYLGAIDIFTSLGARLVPVPVERDGARIDVLRETVTRTRPRLVYLMPTFQNPTGVVMPERERRSMARLAEELAIPILEDDTLADLSLGSTPPAPIAARSARAPVLTVGSLSKLFWGGLRIGWIRASEEILSRIARLKIMADLGGSVLSQLVAVRLLAHAERVKQERRRQLRERLKCLTKLLARHLPSWSWTPPPGGLSLWVRLPHGNADEFAQVALRHGVSVVAGTLASPDGSCSDHLRLPFVLEADRMKEGVERLARAWDAYSPAERKSSATLDVLV